MTEPTIFHTKFSESVFEKLDKLKTVLAEAQGTAAKVSLADLNKKEVKGPSEYTIQRRIEKKISNKIKQHPLETLITWMLKVSTSKKIELDDFLRPSESLDHQKALVRDSYIHHQISKHANSALSESQIIENIKRDEVKAIKFIKEEISPLFEQLKELCKPKPKPKRKKKNKKPKWEVDGEHISDQYVFQPHFHSYFETGRQFIEELDLGCYPFTTPDNTPIAYMLSGDKKGRYRAGRRFFKHVQKKAARNGRSALPCRLNLWSGRYQKQWLICLDIDNLACAFSREAKNFAKTMCDENGLSLPYCEQMIVLSDHLRKHLQEKFGEYGFAFLSAKSRKPKVLLCIEYDEPVKRPNLKHVQQFLTELVPDLVAKGGVDLTRPAVSTTFFDWDKKEMFADAMASLKPIPVKKTHGKIEFHIGEKKVEISDTFEYLMLPLVPDSLASFCTTELEEKAMRALCCMSALAKSKHFGISTHVLARTIGCGVTTARHLLKRFIEKGLLKCTNSHFVVGKKARMYSARGELRAHLKRCIKKASRKMLPNVKRKIADGKWHVSLLSLATSTFRYCLHKFIPFVKTIAGSDEGDRMFQAMSIQTWLLKKHPELQFAFQLE